MDFFSVNGLSCIVCENQLVLMLLWCRTEKFWLGGKQKKTLNPTSTGSWKLKSTDDKVLIMGSNLHAGSMQQSGHNNFEQNHCLLKISAKKCRPLGCLPSKALIAKEMRGTESGNKLHSMVWKKYKILPAPSRSCLIRTEEKTRLVGSHVCLHFPRFSQIEWFCGEGLLPLEVHDVEKQIQTFFSTKGIPAGSSPDSQPPTTEMSENAIFVKSHLKKWLFSLPKIAPEPRNLSNP
jgi:hypothetical protein